MTTLFVGDIHLKSARVLPAVDRAVAMTGADGVVFLGDICDDWGATAREAVAAVRMFADWVAARRAAGLDMTMLAGNHDLPYLARPRSPEFHWFRREADGFKPRAHEDVHEALKPLDVRLAWRRGRVLATHAGVTGAWAAYAGCRTRPRANSTAGCAKVRCACSTWRARRAAAAPCRRPSGRTGRSWRPTRGPAGSRWSATRPCRPSPAPGASGSATPGRTGTARCSCFPMMARSLPSGREGRDA